MVPLSLRRLLRAVLLPVLALAGTAAAADPVRTEHVEADLVVATAAIQPGKPFTVGARLKVQPGWHIYWINPGDAGLATAIDWKLPAGFTAGAIQWPYPTRLQIPGAVNYGYEGDVLLPVTLTAPVALPAGRPAVLRAHLSWVVCAEVCVPGDADVTTSVPVAAAVPSPDPRWTAAFAAARAAQPAAVPGWRFGAERTGDGYRLIATPASGQAVPAGDMFFFSIDENILDNGAAQPIGHAGARIVATLKKASYAEGTPRRLHGVWVAKGGLGAGDRGGGDRRADRAAERAGGKRRRACCR